VRQFISLGKSRTDPRSTRRALHEAHFAPYGFHVAENETRGEKSQDFPKNPTAKKVFHKIDHPTTGGCKNEQLKQARNSDVTPLGRTKSKKQRFIRGKTPIAPLGKSKAAVTWNLIPARSKPRVSGLKSEVYHLTPRKPR
jgi:hypothetical protein